MLLSVATWNYWRAGLATIFQTNADLSPIWSSTYSIHSADKLRSSTLTRHMLKQFNQPFDVVAVLTSRAHTSSPEAAQWDLVFTIILTQLGTNGSLVMRNFTHTCKSHPLRGLIFPPLETSYVYTSLHQHFSDLHSCTVSALWYCTITHRTGNTPRIATTIAWVTILIDRSGTPYLLRNFH